MLPPLRTVPLTTVSRTTVPTGHVLPGTSRLYTLAPALRTAPNSVRIGQIAIMCAYRMDARYHQACAPSCNLRNALHACSFRCRAQARPGRARHTTVLEHANRNEQHALSVASALDAPPFPYAPAHPALPTPCAAVLATMSAAWCSY